MVLVGQNFRAEPLTEFRGFNWSAKLPQFPAVGGQSQGGDGCGREEGGVKHDRL